MSESTSITSKLRLEGLDEVRASIIVATTLGLLLLPFVYERVIRWYKLRKFTTINDCGIFDLFSRRAKANFAKNARSLIEEGFAQNKNIFRLHTDLGPTLVLNARYAEEVKNDDRLSPRPFSAKEFQSHTPGFEPFKFFISEHHIAQDAIRMKLNKNLDSLPPSLSEEAADILQKQWTDNTGTPNPFFTTRKTTNALSEWHEILAYPTALYIVAQTSALAMLGPDMCRNEQWLALATGYTSQAFASLAELKSYPSPLRPLIHWLLPGQRRVRALLAQTRALVNPVVLARRQERERLGAAAPAHEDALQWVEELARGRPYDPAVAQLTIAMASLHSTVDFLVQLLVDLIRNAELVRPLREEVVAVLGQSGGAWSKSALFNLRLMDSVMKESQRLKPISQTFMKYAALQDVTMRDGTILPKGSFVCVSAEEMWSPSNFQDPERFDGYRHLERSKQQDTRAASQLVSVTPEHIAFGFGKRACPGRFFVAAEVKIILAHILLKYDFKLAEGCEPVMMRKGTEQITDPTTRLLVRRREEDVAL